MTATDLITLDDAAVADPTSEVTTAVVQVPDASSPSLPDGPATEPVGVGVEDKPAERPESVIDLGDQLGAAVGRLDAVDARLAELAGRLESTSAAVESVREESGAIEEAGTQTAGRLVAAEGRLDSADSAAQVVQLQITEVVSRLASVDARLDSIGDQLAALTRQQVDHERALTEVSRTIAVEVERHTTDALVDTRHNLQLAVNSMAQLSLAMAESARDVTEDVSAESATALLDSFRVDLDAILGQLGFSSLGTTVGAGFDPHRHRALKRVGTTDPAQDKIITRVIRDGYHSTDTGRILLFADVEVSRHRPG